MRSSHSLDALSVQFDDPNAVAFAGLILPATVAQHLGLSELLSEHVNLGDAPGRANVGNKAMTVVSSLMAGGDCIDDGDALRAGETGKVLARAWSAGASPADKPMTIDLDSTICETYGLKKQGGSHFTYNHVRGYHPLISIMASTGDVVHTRLRGGPSHAGRGAASFVTETVKRVRAAGAESKITIRADSGFYNHKVVAACRKAGVHFSITVKMMGKALDQAFRDIPDEQWVPIDYFIKGAAVAEITYTPFATRKGTKP